ncbi:MAG TPA: glycosyl transferase family 36 [Firmicutes bacterium]|nr:glycosyl transferase family 36 [Bacillota bacterium]
MLSNLTRQNLNELVQFARKLAAEHVTGLRFRGCFSVTRQFSADLRRLNQIFQRYRTAIAQKRTLPPACEWLVDNMYLINEQAQFIKKNLSWRYCQKLPTLIEGPDKGQKRIYALIYRLLEYTGGQCDLETLKGFLWEYQTAQPLTMAELWVVPLVFRMAIIHKLRALFELVDKDVVPEKQANIIGKHITPLLKDISNTLQRTIRIMEQRLDLSNPTVLVYLAKYLREYVESSALHRWLEARTAMHNLSLIQLIEEEQQRQSEHRVSAGQLITSLRQISQTIWEPHFEELSWVELTLRRDPAGVYPKMTFASRDILRHKLEKLAERWRMSELLIAEQVIKLAENAPGENKGDNVKKHVGYYLMDEGCRLLPGALGIRKSACCGLREKLSRFPKTVYFTTMAVLTNFFMYATLRYMLAGLPGEFWWIIPLAVPALLVLAGEWAIRHFHYILTITFPPQQLLKMDFRKGVPKEYSTMVVIPTIINSLESVESLAHKLEIYYLANQDPNIYFGLLTDFADADQAVLAGEDELLKAATERINELNRRYCTPEDTTRFFLFHRKRLWNPQEGKWMGWERKRGKLAEFNALLCGESETSFSHIVGDTEILPQIRFVITLDTDTRLPRDTAKGLIGALAHPLNTPHLDKAKKKVVRGYGLLQPRIAISHASVHRSYYAKIYGGEAGIDIYSGADSDPYQDLFQCGIFTGKGIYDVRVFHHILGDRIPDNMVLSHDLLEGSFVRAGLVTDLELIDDYPTTFLSALERMHRWVRGDWQLLPWLTSNVKNRFGVKTEVKNDLVSRWQMFDNLRRSLVGPATFALICLGIFVYDRLPIPDWPLWVVVGSTLLRILVNFGYTMRYCAKSSHYLIRFLFYLVVLPHHVYKMLDAVFRTLYRLYISHRKLLEWVTAEEVGKRSPNTFVGVCRRMLTGELLTAAIGAVLWLASGKELALIITLIWLSAPVWVYLISRQLVPYQENPDPAEQAYFRGLAWRTWKFYVDTVTEKDHHLPPDNLQLDPPVGLAHRTSPTNIGLYLCSVVTARDLGYITFTEMLERLQRTMDTLGKLPRWNGHFYNWYDTTSLEALNPIYVSTVDSGNLVGYLFAVKQGIAEHLKRPAVDESLLLGLLDMVRWEQACFDRHLYQLQQELEQLLAKPPATVEQWLTALTALQKLADRSVETAQAIAEHIRFLTGRTANSLSGKEIAQAQRLMAQIQRCALEHDFSALYNEEHHLFAIGYNVANKQMDGSFYDLFASEMRQTSFVAIALGQVPLQHWFALKRTMTPVEQTPTLVSWSGTMFEYFMPLLLLPNYQETIWDVTYRMVIRKQMAYARRKGLPWGISESGFSLQDYNKNYQYKAFGVPGLGLKQGLEKDMVVTPYATLLAAMLAPKAAYKNLKRLEEEYQMLGMYGFYEAVDFTPDHMPKDAFYVVVKNHMAHHQGMILNAIANILLDNVWQKRFLKEERMEATEQLLQERIPKKALILSQNMNLIGSHTFDDYHTDLRSFYQPDTPLPEARLLSNGRYTLMISNSGSGFSRWKGLDLTRWVEDPVRDLSGSFYFIRNMTNGQIWSPTYLPCRVAAEDMKMEFFLGRVNFSRTDGDIRTEMAISVAPDLDAEIREITLTNQGSEDQLLEITSLLELALAPHEQFQTHPAYSRLFLETAFIPEMEVLLAWRRTDLGPTGPYLAYMMHVDGTAVGALEYETDRLRFAGRGRSASVPLVIQTGYHLSGTVGKVLDPIFSLRRRVELPGHRRARLFCVTAIAETREEVLEICRKLRYPFQVRRVFDMAVTKNKLELNELNITPRQANIFQWMASQLVYFNNLREQRVEALKRNIKGQSGLWPFGISGDYPIVSLSIGPDASLELVETMLAALKYWAIHDLTVDLVLLVKEADGYNRLTDEELRRIVNTHIQNEAFSKLAAHIFIIGRESLAEAERHLLAAVSRIQLNSQEGTLISQLLQNTEDDGELSPAVTLQLPAVSGYITKVMQPPEDLLFYNGWGGFRHDGKEYVIYLKANDLPPQPWVNVIANPHFGFLLSDSGSGFTWARNSREFRLTPWSNDPVYDPLGEICYLRDEESGLLWSATPSPIPHPEPYTVRHGQGYSIISHQSQGIAHEACYWATLHDPVKIIELKIKNTDEKPRWLSVTYYLEWVLGVDREKTYPYIVTELDSATGALLARNTYQDHFLDHYGFLDLWTEHPVEERSYTGNRGNFMGRSGSMYRPAGLERASLDNRVGANYNPCGAIQVKIRLAPGEEAALYILVGAAPSRIAAQQYLQQYRRRKTVLQSRTEVMEFWRETLERVQVETADKGFDFLMNNWLLYQTLSCRIWARSAFYQSGGAFGFRDQLQDVLALLHTRPDLARKQILLHAAHQYQEGDVQHWWHTETGYGIRTRYSDDMLWLVYVACRYASHTGDQSIWDENIPFLQDAPLSPEERERYGPTRQSKETASLYVHCVRAVDRAAVFGAHSLPLIGGGDWNDGMNKVGAEGYGESVWLAWFLYKTIEEFLPVCARLGDEDRVKRYRLILDQIVMATENSGWDGQWYRRAYNDQGNPMGSVNNFECQIDCIAQAWAVLSGAAPRDKATTAMWSLYHRLVMHDEAIINLLSPPFSETKPSPGYIQAYPPGVRENGGQYTHGAIWAIIAWAMLGEGNIAGELFRLINPIYHAQTPREAQTYRLEPYVVAADVYSAPPYVGRGGWSWYTGSAGWMYQAGLEWILGIQRQGEYLLLRPCIPEDWPGYKVNYRYGNSIYQIVVANPDRKQTGLQKLIFDGEELDPADPRIPLLDDGKTHRVEATL